METWVLRLQNGPGSGAGARAVVWVRNFLHTLLVKLSCIFVHSHRSLRSLTPQRSTSLRLLRSLAPFTGSLTYSAHSLVGQLKFMNMCSCRKRVQWEQTQFLSSLETHSLFPSQAFGRLRARLGKTPAFGRISINTSIKITTPTEYTCGKRGRNGLIDRQTD